MDISTLSLPLRVERGRRSLFGISPSVTSVNVSYETASAINSYPDASIQNEAGIPKIRTLFHSDTDSSTTVESPTAWKPQESLFSKNEELPSPTRNSSSNSINGQSPGHSKLRCTTPISPTSSTHEFPIKCSSPQYSRRANDVNSINPSPSKLNSARRQRARSSFSLASAECQNFVASLKEPKYTKPLSPDEISWVFQDFYSKLRYEILGSDDELLSLEEQEAHKETEFDIEAVLDKAERAITGGELYSKLLALGGNHDSLLQPRISLARENPAILAALAQKLEISEDLHTNNCLHGAIHYLNRLNRETSPKNKLIILIKAHHAIVDSLPKSSTDADTVFPLFVLALTQSSAIDWWQTFLFCQRFRRAQRLIGQAAYCLTNLEASIHVLEQFTLENVPEGIDAEVLLEPLSNPRAPRERSGSQSSKSSSSNSATTVSFSQRLGETLSSYRSLLVQARKPPAVSQQDIVDQKFMNADADSLTLGDVRALLAEYKKLAEFVESRKMLTLCTAIDGKPA